MTTGAVRDFSQMKNGENMNTALETFLNSLAEAERAGGRVLHELTEQAHSLVLREMLKKSRPR